MAPQGAGHAAFMTSCEFSKTREEDTRQGEVTPLAELWAPRNRASKVETALPGPRGLGLLRSKRTAGEAGQAHASLLPRGDVLLHQSWGNRKIGGKTQHGACERKPRLSSRNTIPKSQKKTFSLKRTCLQTQQVPSSDKFQKPLNWARAFTLSSSSSLTSVLLQHPPLTRRHLD